MSYRNVKRLLGETSLERKCRFLFGGGLMLLISGSFYFYAQLNLRIVDGQTRERARLLIKPRLLVTHLERARFLPPGDDQAQEMSRTLLEALAIGQDADAARGEAAGLTPQPAGGVTSEPGDEAQPDYTFALLSRDPLHPDASKRPGDGPGHEAVKKISTGEAAEWAYNDRDKGQYFYFGAVVAAEACINCHRTDVAGQEELQLGDLLGVARITFPLAETQRTLAKNNAVLAVMAILVGSLAMLGAWAIVRYVVVKPVLHLKTVSDQIARGELDQRADIRTGDEFEELSSAFNRMLRYLVHMQDEARDTNEKLDAKVDELAQANLSLFEMNKVKNEFLATMSHELRTPLNSILGFSEVLSNGDGLNDRQKRYAKNIDTSGRTLLALIDDILDLAKIEAGKMRRTPTEFSVADLVERQVSAMQPIAEKRTIELTQDVEPMPSARQDVGKLQQVLGNLLSNAIKFTPEGGRVRVEARLLDPPSRLASPNVQLSVIDTGIGVPLQDQAVIFEKFRQGRSGEGESDPLTREYEGTGLGLSIVKELTRLLGGEVTLQSEFGKGSTFTVTVPLHIEPDEDDSADGASLKVATVGLAPMSKGNSSDTTGLGKPLG